MKGEEEEEAPTAALLEEDVFQQIRRGKKYRADFYSPTSSRDDVGVRPSDLLLNLALATKLSLVAGPRAAARRHEGAPKDVLDAPEQRAIMTDCSADAARPNLPEP